MLTAAAAAAIALVAALMAGAPGQAFRIVIIGDRTGTVQPGVYEQVWREAAAWKPDLAINVGDSIQGGDDRTVDAEWNALKPLLAPYSRIPLYLTPGNHDIWSEASRRAWERHTRRPAHYSFDQGPVHVTVLDNSQSESLVDAEMRFLEEDLARAASRPVKMVFFHRPSWLIPVMLGSDFPLDRVARKHHVQYIVSGHTHRFARFERNGVVYLMVGSSGGHLRAKGFEDGWFFHHVRATVAGGKVSLVIKEVDPPLGQGRTFTDLDWGSGPSMRAK